MKTVSFLIALAVAFALPAQEKMPAFPVTLAAMPVALSYVVDTDLDVLVSHTTTLVSLSGFDKEGLFQVSFAGEGHEASKFVASQGPIGQEPVPMLRTQWCDELNVTHEVVTPIVSQTEAGLNKALALHEKLVTVMQQKHPPKPCTPP